MFPFLPALLLLLLQSHSALDRAMVPGLQAITWQIVAQQLAREGDEKPSLQRAYELVHLLQSPVSVRLAPETQAEDGDLKPLAVRHEIPQGFTQGRRTRDGPGITA